MPLTESIGQLKNKIKKQTPISVQCAVSQLELFLAGDVDLDGKRHWLKPTDKDVKALRNEQVSDRIKKLTQEKLNAIIYLKTYVGNDFECRPGEVHVFAKIPEPKGDVLGKRVRADAWFDEDSLAMKKRKRSDDENKASNFFAMLHLPPIAHPMQKYDKVMVRESYVVIFDELMQKAKWCLDDRTDANMLVTGTPGTGKSRFYLYCLLQIIAGQHPRVKALPSFDLVINFNDCYHKYEPDMQSFCKLSSAEATEMREKRDVIRVPGLTDYAKVNSFRYIMPVWTLRELRDYKELLEGSKKLENHVLLERYHKFGGIPRFIFTRALTYPNDRRESAIRTLAMALLKNPDIYQVVRPEEGYTDFVLEMMPTRPDYRASFKLMPLSNVFGRGLDIRGSVYETLCQRVSTLAQENNEDQRDTN
ncbi:hypothetical protein Poli38472_004485 [Pythium oligandrum]|uniref:Crinkler effector protein N-terminal domain-containing protein n=1 Tax=Pythium oligandrum TaxID=41045 RepID=A0A8K1FEH2_PYTOL|nr:hypothetical protein Poli38472_004485 [Pythium oligandrum]|eukprot:TMW59416.1 hypothetical protein Poli38472_004485 [Pythium oligandrum]